MEILPYEDWMRPQVIQLFVDEYRVDFSEFEQLFIHFYESPFQKGKSIRIVALDGKTVGGFQSFFYWPLQTGEKEVVAWQSGNSLVSPAFRGKGLFAKMLDYIHQPNSGFNAELLIGFPVEMSYNSFIRNKWNNIFNLQWHIKLGSPLLSLLRYGSSSIDNKLYARAPFSVKTADNILRVQQSMAFDTYRFHYQKPNQLGRLHLSDGDLECFVEFKIQIRKKIIRELVLGKVLFSSTADITRCLKLFQRVLQRLNSTLRPTMFSFAFNPSYAFAQQLAESTGFKKIDKHVYFITKGKLAETLSEASLWDIQRGDIDTW